MRSASRRLFTKISVERCARTSSSSLGWMALQIEGRAGPCEAGPLGRARYRPAAPCLRPELPRADQASWVRWHRRSSPADRPAQIDSVRFSKHPVRRILRIDGRLLSASRAVSATTLLATSVLGAAQEIARPLPAAVAWPKARCAAAGARTDVPAAPSESARCEPRLVGTSA